MKITAIEAIKILKEKIADTDLHPSKMVYSVGELRELLSKVDSETRQDFVEKAIIITLDGSKVIMMANIWQKISKQGIDFDETEEVLNHLVALKKVKEEKIRGFTFYSIVKEVKKK